MSTRRIDLRVEVCESAQYEEPQCKQAAALCPATEARGVQIHNEVAVLQTLEHTNIVKLHGVLEDR